MYLHSDQNNYTGQTFNPLYSDSNSNKEQKKKFKLKNPIKKIFKLIINGKQPQKLSQLQHFDSYNNHNPHNAYIQDIHHIENFNEIPEAKIINENNLSEEFNVVYSECHNHWKIFSKGAHRFVIIGETGSGKSTFINTMTSFFLDGTLKYPRICIPNMYYDATETYDNTERDILDNSKAQTHEVTEYLFGSDEQSVIFMDTPGINDTNGLDQDDINLDKILTAVAETNFISGIILLINGTNSRITSSIQSLFDRFNGILPDYIMNNIIVVFTMCRKTTCNFKNLNNLGFTPAKVFYMNNTAFSSNPNEWDDANIILNEWNTSMSTCNKIITFGTQFSQFNTFDFQQIRSIRNNIKQSLHETRIKIINILIVKLEYENAKIEAKKCEDEATEFKNRIKNTTIIKNTLVPHTKHSTICSSCTTICHFECGLDEQPANQYTSVILQCNCINYKSSICEQCNCPATSHYHGKFKKGTIETTLEDEIEIAKYNAMLEIVKTKKNNANTKYTDYNLIDIGIRSEIDKLKNALVVNCKNLKKICKKYNIVSELGNEIIELKRESRNIDDVHIRELYEEFITHITYLANELSQVNLNEPEKVKKRSFFKLFN